MNRPRLRIEDWCPAAAIGVECIRDCGSVGALAPHSCLHVWWARRSIGHAPSSVEGVPGGRGEAGVPRETAEATSPRMAGEDEFG